MPRHQIVCTKKDSHGTITHYGVLIAKEGAIKLHHRKHRFFLVHEGKEVSIDLAQGDSPYFHTLPDRTPLDNLEYLPECHCGGHDGADPFKDFLKDIKR
jgi:hypothetical protein